MKEKINERIKELKQKSDEFYNAHIKCLGAIEVLFDMKKEFEEEELQKTKK